MMGLFSSTNLDFPRLKSMQYELRGLKSPNSQVATLSFSTLLFEFLGHSGVRVFLYNYQITYVNLILNQFWYKESGQKGPHISSLIKPAPNSRHNLTMRIQWMATFNQHFPFWPLKVGVTPWLPTPRSDFNFEYWELCMRYQCPFSPILSSKYAEIAEIFIKT